MTKRLILIYSILGVILLLVVFGISNVIRRPKADVVSSTTQDIKKSFAIMTGNVTNTKGQAMPNIVVSIENEGVLTEAKGSYLLTTAQEGDLFVSFEDPSTGDKYQPTNNDEPRVFMMHGDNLQRDFTLEKIASNTAITPVPAASVAPTLKPTASPTCRRVLFHTVCS